MKFKLKGRSKPVFEFIRIMTYCKIFKPSADYWYKKALEQLN